MNHKAVKLLRKWCLSRNYSYPLAKKLYLRANQQERRKIKDEVSSYLDALIPSQSSKDWKWVYISKVRYLDTDNLTISQELVMEIVDDWVRKVKTPVPHCEILKRMKKKGEAEGTVKYSILSLIAKHYIRRAIVLNNRSSYVQLRRL